MANLNFFAAEADQKALVDYLFSSTDVRVFESYSEFGQDLREFRSLRELASAFTLGEDKYGSGYAILLQLWSPSVMKEFEITRIELRPEKCNGHTFRFRFDGTALIQLYFGGVHAKQERVVTYSHFGHYSIIRLQKYGGAAEVNFSALNTLSNKIQYHIRKRLAVARVPGCPVLPQALKLARSGYALKRAAGVPFEYKLI